MPLYEYRCKSCRKNLEILQKTGEGAKKKCPECGGKLEKLVSPSAFHLKGSGWYKTDYAAKKADANPSDGAKKNAKSPDPPCANDSCKKACPNA